jgi:hypothetical protein
LKKKPLQKYKIKILHCFIFIFAIFSSKKKIRGHVLPKTIHPEKIRKIFFQAYKIASFFFNFFFSTIHFKFSLALSSNPSKNPQTMVKLSLVFLASFLAIVMATGCLDRRQIKPGFSIPPIDRNDLCTQGFGDNYYTKPECQCEKPSYAPAQPCNVMTNFDQLLTAALYACQNPTVPVCDGTMVVDITTSGVRVWCQ